MKKRQTASKIKEQAPSIAYVARKPARLPSTDSMYADPNSIKPHRRISYSAGEFIREEPAELPRLFIQGLYGGSFRLDLRGLNVGFSDGTFAYWVADESLSKLDIHQGDIAIIDPMRDMRSGDLLLLLLDGREVLRRLSKKKRVWFLETADGSPCTPRPLRDESLLGIVLGILRLFTKVKAIRSRGTEANFTTPIKYKSSPANIVRFPTAGKTPLKKSKPRRYPLPLAAEGKSPYRLSEIEEKSPYRARATTRCR